MQAFYGAGRSLQLNYLDKALAKNNDRFKGVVSIDSPVGRFRYDYGNEPPKGAAIDRLHLQAKLVNVTYPQEGSYAVSRHYHYEDPVHPTRLTGITVDGAGSDGKALRQRVATWAYDGNGKAILASGASRCEQTRMASLFQVQASSRSRSSAARRARQC